MSKITFDVEDNTGIARGEIGRIAAKMNKEMPRDVAKGAARLVRRRIKQKLARNRGTRGKLGDFDNDLSNSIRVTELTEGLGQGEGAASLVFGATNPRTGVNYAAWHEFADHGHYAAIGEGINQPLTRWAKKNIGNPLPVHKIFVHPHPFIKPTIQQVFKELGRKTVEEMRDFLSEVLG